MLREKNRAFTLVELLVVIAIIAVLLSILVPALNKIREQAKKMVCAAHMHSVGLALMLYEQDHEYIPHSRPCQVGSVRHRGMAWKSLMNIMYDNDFEYGGPGRWNDHMGVGWVGPGLLFRNGYLGEDLMILWCPTKRFAVGPWDAGSYPHHNRDTYLNYRKWKEFFANAGNLPYDNQVRSAYCYQPIEPVDLLDWLGDMDNLGPFRSGEYKDRRKSNMSQKVALFDNPGTNTGTGLPDPTDIVGGTHEGGVNCLMWDGSSKFFRKNFGIMADFRYQRRFIQTLDRQ
ncbi:MAG: prepilin-type N-terminal cleavage/methylation domain-containing protein [Planctomycetota bacterium]